MATGTSRNVRWVTVVGANVTSIITLHSAQVVWMRLPKNHMANHRSTKSGVFSYGELVSAIRPSRKPCKDQSDTTESTDSQYTTDVVPRGMHFEWTRKFTSKLPKRALKRKIRASLFEKHRFIPSTMWKKVPAGVSHGITVALRLDHHVKCRKTTQRGEHNSFSPNKRVREYECVRVPECVRMRKYNGLKLLYWRDTV
ncbi:hypothetical protein CSKR_108729 [Clonorchis sinensis]|uniref:Uncharacterized protein n=1 Tax=Clonorchis sinensis TaxID=79923 RepID=A0A3R7GG82_CLOSI|nr:hypothetical protein CSKR_108729 [Clonorchis sinensis]